MNISNLPSQPTPFIGRERELSEISALLNDRACRLMTLVGSGGIGKTRLAIEAAQHISLRDGVYFVALQPLTSHDFIIPAIAEALNLQFYGSNQPKQQLLNYLSETALLLVLDNFEHLLDGVQLLSEILSAAPGIKLLVTSRERLNLAEEWVLDMAGLSFPSGEADASIEDYSAVQLFTQRAQQTQASFSLSANVQAVRQICQQVEGMPLALELAASWLRAMSCDQVVAHMGSSINFLTTPLRNVPERQRSMRSVFEQSWNLLSTAEQDMLMRLSVFRGGFDLEFAEGVAGASLPMLAALADKSLIRLNASGRYDLHELLRQYAADKLMDANLTAVTVRRHLDYFLKLAEQAEAHAFGREQTTWFDRLEVELDNLRAALAWSLRDEEAEIGLRLVAALGWFFSERDHVPEGLDWLERMLASNENAPPSLRAKALHSAGALAGILTGERQSRPYCEQALALARPINDRWNIAWSLSHLAIFLENDLNQFAALLDESLALFRELDDAMGIAHTLIRRAWCALRQRDYPYMDQLNQEAVIRAREAGDKIITAWTIYNMANAYWKRDHDLEQARIQFENSLLRFREARLQIGYDLALMMLSRIEQEMGNVNHAQKRLEETLFSMQKTGLNTQVMPLVFSQLVGVARELGQFERAATLLGAANIHDTFDVVKTQPEFQNALTALRSELGEIVFAEAWSAGNAMTLNQATTYALESGTAAAERLDEPDLAQITSNPLTKREIEILSLMAEGFPNKGIAERLFLTPGTVKWYVSEIYGKLDVKGRVQAVTRARELKLLA